MKRLLTLLSMLLFFLNSFPMSNEVRIMESLSMYSKILGQDVKYSVCLPENYFKDSDNYPVVYLLHGLGDDETSWLEYGDISQISDKLVKDGEIVPMIFVIPQGFRTYYVNDFAGNFRYQDMFIQELIPFIDSHYRTMADKKHRATMGYSMGGFGALILPLKNPDVISTCVPLSISIRTDKQYMTEDALEWDKQWGSLFGGIGKVGEERITEYYKQNCPFHIFPQNDLSKLKDLKIYIDNGDDEHTLCRSNEELHILLRDKGVQHEFRVRDGGHSFQYWCSALPNTLRFISDAFESKPYRGDIKTKSSEVELPENQLQKLTIGNDQLLTFVPAEYNFTSRLYPAIYFAGNFTFSQEKSVAAFVNKEIEDNIISPVILVFLPENGLDRIEDLLPISDEKMRIRKGYRFHALIGYQNNAFNAFKTAINHAQFSSCILSDAYILEDSITNLIPKLNSEELKKLSIFIDSPDKGKFYDGNGYMHILLRENEIQHEYRVREGNGGFIWFMDGLPEIISLISKRFHR